MRIRSGSRVLIPRNGTSVAVPQNRNMSVPVTEAIDTYATMAVRKSVEAIRTDGYPVFVYRSKQGTQVCTCRKGEDNGPFAEEIPVGENYTITDTLISSEDSLGSQPKQTVRLRGYGAEDSFDRAARPDIKKAPEQEYLDGPGTSFEEIDGNYSVQPGGDFSDLINLFPSLGKTACGICGGSGMVNGYKWMSGEKIMLLPENAKLSGEVSIDTSARPYALEFSDSRNTFAEWVVDLPAYHINILFVKVKNNAKISPEFIIEYYDPVLVDQNDADGWQRLRAGGLAQYRDTGVRSLRLRVNLKAGKLGEDELAVMTHGEIWVLQNELPYCQMPQIDLDINGGVMEAINSSQFEIDPGIGTLSRGSIIENPVMGRMWVVTSVKNARTSKGYVFNISGSLTVVEPMSPPYAIAAIAQFNGKQPTHWRGLERGREHGLPFSDDYHLDSGIHTKDEVDK